MASQQQERKISDKIPEKEKKDLDQRAAEGETVVPGGKNLEVQERLAEGRSKGGETRKELLGAEGYQEMGKKGGLSTGDKSVGERAVEEGIPIDESKYTHQKRLIDLLCMLDI